MDNIARGRISGQQGAPEVQMLSTYIREVTYFLKHTGSILQPIDIPGSHKLSELSVNQEFITIYARHRLVQAEVSTIGGFHPDKFAVLTALDTEIAMQAMETFAGWCDPSSCKNTLRRKFLQKPYVLRLLLHNRCDTVPPQSCSFSDPLIHRTPLCLRKWSPYSTPNSFDTFYHMCTFKMKSMAYK